MHRTLNAVAATAVLAVSSAAFAEINTCDVDVTHARVAEEKVCYAGYGPKSGKWDPRDTPELDALSLIHI